MNLEERRNFDWKPSPSICRCCLSEGCYKDISSEYYCYGEKEIYEEILKETLDIQYVTLPNKFILERDIMEWKFFGHCSSFIRIESARDSEYNDTKHVQIWENQIPYHQDLSSRLICEDCIVRLRDARAFKQSIQKSEATLNQYYDALQPSDDVNMKAEPKLMDVKAEPMLPDGDCDDKNDAECRDDASLEDDEILADIKLELTRMDDAAEDGKPAKAKRKPKKSRIKYESTECPQDKWSKLAERRGTGPLLRENSLKLLANSTMCVFQWNKSWYRCFCCKEPFPDMALLKHHTQSSHTLENIKKKIILQQNRLVKVEVSDLTCKICERPMENLSGLREHLSEHGIRFELNEDLLVPFKIEANLKCQICSESFSVFRLLNMHMNKHYQKQVCHICGAAFSNLVFLNLHKTRSHRPFRCKHCGEVFGNKMDKKHHEISVHGVKFERKLRFPCPYCTERFFQENFRVLHLVEKHGMPKPEHKCLVCEKSFVTRSLCNNHMKNVHMKEKNHECDVCHNLFYTKSDVARHRVTHTGEKRFSCTLCSNPFATKDSLRRHMKRTHVGLH